MTALGAVIKEMQLTEIFATGQHDYEWAEFRAWQAPSGRLYWFADSGCSCREYGDGFESAANLGDGDRDALERMFRTWVAENHGYCPTEAVIEGLEKLRRLR